MLYLAWLRVMEVEDLLDSIQEPPVPSGLEELSPALRAFIAFFEIDEMLVQVAAEASGQRQAGPQAWLEQAILRLSREERDAFLLRLAERSQPLSQVESTPASGRPPARAGSIAPACSRPACAGD